VIIITAYLPIFTLQAVEGRLFRPMALTVAFALLGALLFSIIIAPVLSSVLFRTRIKEWHNPVMRFLISNYGRAAAMVYSATRTGAPSGDRPLRVRDVAIRGWRDRKRVPAASG
jgi:Cu/Ag efflux pump CusA